MGNELTKSECRWIPVTERLPEDNEEVLISIDGKIYLCFYCEALWHYNNLKQPVLLHEFALVDGSFCFIEGENFPTHWMPLPEPA